MALHTVELENPASLGFIHWLYQCRIAASIGLFYWLTSREGDDVQSSTSNTEQQ